MPPEEKNQQSNSGVDVAAIIAAALAGGGASTGSQSVYLGGTSGTRPVKMKKTGQTVNIPVPRVTTIQEANALYLTDPKVRSGWAKTMKKYGLETGNPLIERKAWEVAVAGASDWYTTSNGKQEVTPEQYLGWYAIGQKGPAKPDLTRQIYNVTPEQINEDINSVAQKVLGRAIVDTDKQSEWYTDLVKGITKMAGRGTTTEVKNVRNKKTGKLEKQVIQTPEVTKEEIAQKITSAVQAADPLSLQRKKDLDFEAWFLENTRGRG